MNGEVLRRALNNTGYVSFNWGTKHLPGCSFNKVLYTHMFEFKVGDECEVPFFLLPHFVNFCINKLYDDGFQNIAVPLIVNKQLPSFKTLDPNIKDCFSKRFYVHGLCRLTNSPNITYAAPAVIFDSDFNVLCTLSLKFKYKKTGDYGNKIFTIEKCLFRVSPKVYLDKKDKVCRYICNQLIPSFMDSNHGYYYNNSNDVIEVFNSLDKVAILIEDIPFNIVKASVPSISTTNEEIMKTVADNIEEIDLT